MTLDGALQILRVGRPEKPASVRQQVGLWIAHLMGMLFEQFREKPRHVIIGSKLPQHAWIVRLL